MRLIDEEVLMKDIQKTITEKSSTIDWMNLIHRQPGAYDIDNVVKQLEEIRVKKTCNKEKCDAKELCRICVVDDAIEIVKQEAEKYEECYKDCGDCEAYNKEKHHCPKFCKVIKETVKEIEENHNGWVPCSERLPEEAFGCLVTVMDCNPSAQTEFENILPYFVGYDGETWNDADGEEIPFEVIAWRKLPTPYQPKGE